MMRQLRGRLPWRVLIAGGVLIVLLAIHGGAIYFVAKHVALSGGIAFGLIALIVIKHLGWLGSAYALLRRRRTLRD